MELYQAEWCPHSHKVRQRLTELGLDFWTRQVAADPDDREQMRHHVGTNEIPVLVPDDTDPELASLYVIELPDDEAADALDELKRSSAVEFAEPQAERWLRG